MIMYTSTVKLLAVRIFEQHVMLQHGKENILFYVNDTLDYAQVSLEHLRTLHYLWGWETGDFEGGRGPHIFGKLLRGGTTYFRRENFEKYRETHFSTCFGQK